MDKSLLKLLALTALALGFVLFLSGCAEPDLTELPLPETPEEVLAELTEARSKIDHRTEQRILTILLTYMKLRISGVCKEKAANHGWLSHRFGRVILSPAGC